MRQGSRGEEASGEALEDARGLTRAEEAAAYSAYVVDDSEAHSGGHVQNADAQSPGLLDAPLATAGGEAAAAHKASEDEAQGVGVTQEGEDAEDILTARGQAAASDLLQLLSQEESVRAYSPGLCVRANVRGWRQLRASCLYLAGACSMHAPRTTHACNTYATGESSEKRRDIYTYIYIYQYFSFFDTKDF